MHSSGPIARPGSEPVVLADLPLKTSGVIQQVDAAAAGQPADRNRLLAEIGFVPGESVTVLARGWPGGDPIVVRVGASRFALRRAEAACIRISRES